MGKRSTSEERENPITEENKLLSDCIIYVESEDPKEHEERNMDEKSQLCTAVRTTAESIGRQEHLLHFLHF